MRYMKSNGISVSALKSWLKQCNSNSFLTFLSCPISAPKSPKTKKKHGKQEDFFFQIVALGE